jgi:hypothetical protein
MKIPGVGPDTPTTTNEAGGKQSVSLYRFDLIPYLALFSEAKVLAEGAKKYGEWNWEKITIQDHLNHALTHIYAFLAGDVSENHLANLACRAHFALDLYLAGHYDIKAAQFDVDETVPFTSKDMAKVLGNLKDNKHV